MGWFIFDYRSVCMQLYASTSVQCPRHIRVAEKLVKGGLNLQDLLCLTIFICKIYLLTILLRFRLPGLKSIYLLWEHHTKSIAESSYSLLWGREFSLQMSLPGDIPLQLHSNQNISSNAIGVLSLQSQTISPNTRNLTLGSVRYIRKRKTS
jgi:hypothetical protein